MTCLILLRHGQSLWNRDDIFTGWNDVDLTAEGVEEAKGASALLKLHGYAPDWCCTSYLRRAIRTLWIVLDEMELMWLPVDKHWRLNERHYGALQGLNKKDTAARMGEETVYAWRRGYDVPPPALDEADERFPGRDPRYAGLTDRDLPRTESLKATVERFLPYWETTIVPQLRAGRTVLVSAHGNSLRALVKHLEQIPDAKIPGVEIPTGNPLCYELDDTLHPTGRKYLGPSD